MTKKLLFPIDSKQFIMNQGRMLRLVRILSVDGYQVDILTPSDEIHAKAVETFKGNENVHVLLVKPHLVPLTDIFKDDLLKTFIRQTHNLLIPETDMKIYKLAAFDDFQGFIMPYTYPDINVSPYSLILMPIISMENFPNWDSDAFFSAICFLAKERKVPLIGLQTQPPFHNAFLYVKFMDYIVVKEEWERKFIERLGFEKERIFLLTDEREAYCLKTCEDYYMNALLDFMDNTDIKIDRKEFFVVLFNHPKYRSQIRQIFHVLDQLDVPAVVFLVKVGYSVKELSEQDVIDGVYGDIINKFKGRVYFAEYGTVAQLLMLADVVISATYMESLGLAACHGKAAAVYNRIFENVETGDGVKFIDDPKELKEMVLKRYNEKKTGYSCLSDLVGKLCSKKTTTGDGQ